MTFEFLHLDHKTIGELISFKEELLAEKLITWKQFDTITTFIDIIINVQPGGDFLT